MNGHPVLLCLHYIDERADRNSTKRPRNFPPAASLPPPKWVLIGPWRPSPPKAVTWQVRFCFKREDGAGMSVSNATDLWCDGCGQPASAEHIARRLRRLAWATRYRPVHIHTLLLGGVAPREDAEFLYAPGDEFRGEAADLLRAVGISTARKAPADIRGEFQGAGFFLTHLLECPVEHHVVGDVQTRHGATETLLREHLPSVASRIRRSLKPRRLTLVTEVPPAVLHDILSINLGCPVVLDDGRPFRFTPPPGSMTIARFQEILSGRPEP